MTGLRTTSLRRRVTAAVLVVLVLLLIAIGFVVDTVFRAQAERDVNSVLTARVQLAQQWAKQKVPPRNLLRRLGTRGVQAALVLPDGTVLGEPDPPPDARIRQVRATLTGPAGIDGARLTLTADESLIATAEHSLRWVLVISSLAALVVAAIAILLAVRFALAPLDAMTRLARSIVSGGRGGRLAPERTGTELGRAAAAFDSALDALEGAEKAARASEAHLRQFVADAAHELRTPLAGVQAAAEALLQQSSATSVAQRERLQLLVVRESQRAGKLVTDLLDLARLDAGAELERVPVPLRELVQAQADQVRLTAPDVIVEVGGPPARVLGDPARLTQILANLTGNAVQAMHGRGRLTLVVAGDGVTVTDTGPGVPDAERERVFDRLVRLDTARGQHAGSGLGLPIARGFARALGGDLRCEPGPGGGARFRLDGLPPA
ncbi:HAMP domain-containing sensor histidine kinase [Amycolatopsis sp. PS_44_ISF1]|uniref:sensor histidine kinase n=1 Tax=Amycolatopsis sp. PS_44_ISF1 TaxID=2974917 RepID=UPI0028E0706F|nr:HAMP domain-containing sensor histidine kinase [Amycolatopsis sp. PS_44_ISF1]MDT8911985.1 HAMP domain-containing histidine kinase [Amycolatopsis sp. PS_44_ISF1]